MEQLPLGKLPDAFLAELLQKYTGSMDERVLLGPKLGEDAGIITMRGDNCLAVAVDPILVDIAHAPHYAVAINVNDIVTRGAIPRWASASIFFPPTATYETVEAFFQELYEAIKPHNISLVTGHTEVSSCVRNPGIVLTLLGEVRRENVITTAGAKPGDHIILAGSAGVEGTALLAENFRKTLARSIDEQTIERACRFIYDPGICIARAAYIAWKYTPHALHDPTEGGIRKGIDELAAASGNGVFIEHEKIPIMEETRRICAVSGDDPCAIFASGALLVSIPWERGRKLLEEYRDAGICAADIGIITKAEEGRIILYNGQRTPLIASHTDGLIERLNERVGGL